MLKVINYTEVEEIVKNVNELGLPTDCEVIDQGAGTGRIGLQLVESGFSNIDAVDASRRFLEALKLTKAYRNSYYMYLGTGAFPEEEHKDHYDLVVSAGIFLTGHMPKTGIQEIIEGMKPGAYWVTAMRERFYTSGEEMGYREEFDRLVNEGKVTITKSY